MGVAQERLSAGELLDIFSLSQNATAVYRTEDIIIEAATDSMLAFWGKDRSVIGKPLGDVIPEIKAQSFIDILQQVWRTGVTYETKEAKAELLIDGRMQTFYFNFTYRAIKKEDGSMYCILHTATDITDAVSNKNLQKTNREHQQALEREQSLNEELAASMEELKSVNDELNLSQEHLITLNDELEKRVENRTREILRSETRFRSLVEQLPAAINLFISQDLVVDLPNQRMLEIWGRSYSDVIDKPLDVGMPELKGQPFMQKLRDVISTGIPYSSSEEKAFIKRNGKLEELYFDIVYQPIINEDGTITSCMQIASDVTEAVLSRQKIQSLNEELSSINEELASANEELLSANDGLVVVQNELVASNRMVSESEERFRNMAESTAVYLAVGDAMSHATYFNKPWTDATGRSMEDLLKFGWVDLVHPDDREKYVNIYLDAFKDKQPFTGEFRLKKENGDYIWLLANGNPRFLPDGSFAGYISSSIDITEQKEKVGAIEQLNTELSNIVSELSESREQFRLAVESAELGFWTLNVKTNAITASPRMKELFGFYPDEEMVFEIAIANIEDSYREQVVKAFQRAITEGKPYDIEYPVKGYRDGKRRWLRATGKIYTEGIEAGNFAGTAADITERKQDEQRKNDFIGMVSHEMKTPLTSLNGYLQLMQMRAGSEDAFAVTMLGKANKQISKMTTLINGFLNVSRLESGQIHIDKHRFDMAILVKEVEEETRMLYNNHNIVFHPVEETFVEADRDKIGQVINNLISNAVKYSSPNTEINVACITQGANAVISVKDEGMGIKTEDQPKLFERYYRVNNDNTTSASGFGIGLYLCAEIIQRHDGRIWVESEVGKGSTFSFSLPVVGNGQSK